MIPEFYLSISGEAQLKNLYQGMERRKRQQRVAVG